MTLSFYATLSLCLSIVSKCPDSCDKCVNDKNAQADKIDIRRQRGKREQPYGGPEDPSRSLPEG
jgi:hypothetical protein